MIKSMVVGLCSIGGLMLLWVIRVGFDNTFTFSGK